MELRVQPVCAGLGPGTAQGSSISESAAGAPTEKPLGGGSPRPRSTTTAEGSSPSDSERNVISISNWSQCFTQLRQELLDGIDSPTAGHRTLADAPVLAYRNLLRVQGWIRSLCLVVERELFGQEPVSEANGATVGERIEREMHRFEHSIMPLLDRPHRMLVRSLDRLEARRSGGGPQAQLSIGRAMQVNVGSAVRNGGG